MNSKIEVTSKRFWLNSKDFFKGFITAFLSASLYAAQVVLDSGEFHPKKVAMAGIAGGIGYLIKNFFQPAQVKKDITSEEVDVLKETTDKASK